MTFQYNDKLGSRSRKVNLYLVHDGKISIFTGQNMPGIVAILRQKYTKDGKWSNTSYELLLKEGVIPVVVRQGWDSGTWAEGMGEHHPSRKYGTWEDWFEAWSVYGVGAVEAERFCRGSLERAAISFDAVRQAVASLYG
jgi:hypothetical protein